MNRASAINFVGRVPLVGKGFRRVARLYREGSIVEIKAGYLAGYKWQRSHSYVSGYWLGNYELPIQECLARELQSGHVFYDIGGNAGFFTLLGSKCVGPTGQVFSFEPLPQNATVIRAQLALNPATNCTVVQAAISEHAGEVEFCAGADTSTAHIHQDHDRRGEDSMAVAAIRLDDFAATSPVPDFIKMDIEGAEVAALNGARQLLGGSHRPKMLIEFHGEQLRRDCMAILEGFGYLLFSLGGEAFDSKTCDRHALCIPRTD